MPFLELSAISFQLKKPATKKISIYTSYSKSTSRSFGLSLSCGKAAISLGSSRTTNEQLEHDAILELAGVDAGGSSIILRSYVNTDNNQTYGFKDLDSLSDFFCKLVQQLNDCESLEQLKDSGAFAKLKMIS